MSRGIGTTLVIFQGQVTVRVCVRVWEKGKRSELSPAPLHTLHKSGCPPLASRSFLSHHAAGLDLPGIGCLGPPGQRALGQGSVWTLPCEDKTTLEGPAQPLTQGPTLFSLPGFPVPAPVPLPLLI